MKAQLLEDIGDSHPLPPLPPRQRHAARTPPPPSPPQPTPPSPPEAPRAAAAPDGVWRRAPEAAPEGQAWAPPPPLPDTPWTSDPPPVWNIPNEPAYSPAPDEPDWFDRWGRRAATATAVLLATLAVGGGGLWLYNESKVDKSLSVLARAPIPARHAQPAPSVSPQPGGPQATLAEQAGTPAAEPAPRVADTSPPQTASQEPAAAAAGAAPPERPRKRAVASKSKASRPAPVQARYASDKSERSDPLKETLRQCRAAGYHAAKCIQLGCTATQYGLACKGANTARR